jgi:copper chaperone CopZ
MSNYIHSIPGRLRVKSSLIKKNPGEAKKVERLLKSMNGVEYLEINLLTGSVLVRYNPHEVGSDTLLQRLTAAGYLAGRRAVTQDEVIHSALIRTGKAVGSLVLGALEIENPALAILAALI